MSYRIWYSICHSCSGILKPPKWVSVCVCVCLSLNYLQEEMLLILISNSGRDFLLLLLRRPSPAPRTWAQKSRVLPAGRTDCCRTATS